jgi:lipoyl synthase
VDAGSGKAAARLADIRVCYLGRVEYEKALALQEQLVAARQAGHIGDTLLILEHPPVLTLGVRGQYEHIYLSRQELQARGVRIFETNRGGDVTYHGPGQVVGYPIFRLLDFPGGIRHFIGLIEKMAIDWLAESYGLVAEARTGKETGIWIGERKIMAIGLAVRQGVSMHGFALNINTDLSHFEWINPCGLAKGVTSVADQIGAAVDFEQACRQIGTSLARVFQRNSIEIEPDQLLADPAPRSHLAKPAWLRVPIQTGVAAAQTSDLLRRLGLNTICEQAGCPNRMECYNQHTATFLILGTICSRNCRFCQVMAGIPENVDSSEPERVAEAVATMKLQHVVLTSVTRDDLPDGGAGHFAAVITAIRRATTGSLHRSDPPVTVEVLIPDLAGNHQALRQILAAKPDVFGHNIETVPRLYATVRPQADYRRSLSLLKQAKALSPELMTKSGLMVGLGETRDEVLAVMQDLRAAGCSMLTIGQYLAPTRQHLPVAEYVHPEQFGYYREQAAKLGFLAVASEPLVRSSYRAGQLLALAAQGG